MLLQYSHPKCLCTRGWVKSCDYQYHSESQMYHCGAGCLILLSIVLSVSYWLDAVIRGDVKVYVAILLKFKLHVIKWYLDQLGQSLGQCLQMKAMTTCYVIEIFQHCAVSCFYLFCGRIAEVVIFKPRFFLWLQGKASVFRVVCSEIFGMWVDILYPWKR